jgi:presenilin-like A22 family membrane protease
MNVLAALLMVIGTGCHLEKPKSISANGVWITSILTATLAILVASNQCKMLRWAVLLAIWSYLLFIMLGLLGLRKEVENWPED